MDLEKRLHDLEIKFSYQDELLNELNLLVANQQAKIEKMTEIIESQSDKAATQFRSLADDRPPHY